MPFGVAVDKLVEFINAPAGDIETDSGTMPNLRKINDDLRSSGAIGIVQESTAAVLAAEQRVGDLANAIEAGVDVPEFLSSAEGIAGVADGEMFAVRAGYDGFTRRTVLRRVGAAAVLVSAPVSGAEFDAIAGDAPQQVPQGWETNDDEEDAALLVLDAADNIIGRVPNAATDPAVVVERWETLDDRPALVDRNGNVILWLDEGSDDGSVAAVAAALAAHIDAQNATNAALDTSQRAASPYLNLSELRTLRMKLARIKHGQNVQAILAMAGDSFSAPNDSYLHIVAKRLQEEYGFAGLGYTGFAWSTSVGPDTEWGAGLQPAGKELSARYDLSPVGDLVQHFGLWGCRRGAFTAPVVLGPTRARVYSTRAGDYIRFYVPAAPATRSNIAALFHAPVSTTPGTVAVSWDDGATYGADIAVPNTTGSIPLPGVPAEGGWARLRVVSGEASLCGANLVNTAPGVILHKLAVYGALASNYGSGTLPASRVTWSQQIKALGPDLFGDMKATNDQAGNVTPQMFAAEMRLNFDALRAEMPAIDTYWLAPPENNRTTNTYPMTAYTEAARKAALQGRHAFIDTQWDVGDPTNFGAAYSHANPNRPWWKADQVHPDVPGDFALAAACLRGIFN